MVISELTRSGSDHKGLFTIDLQAPSSDVRNEVWFWNILAWSCSGRYGHESWMVRSKSCPASNFLSGPANCLEAGRFIVRGGMAFWNGSRFKYWFLVGSIISYLQKRPRGSLNLETQIKYHQRTAANPTVKNRWRRFFGDHSVTVAYGPHHWIALIFLPVNRQVK